MEIQIEVKGKPVPAYLAVPQPNQGPGILLLHAWWGLKPFFKELCERLSKEGFCVLAPNLYNGGVARTIPEAEAMMEKSDGQFMREIIVSSMDHLLAHPACATRTLGMIGFSMGAGFALSFAARRSKDVSAVVLYYGMGDTDFGKVSASVLGHFSDVDEWESYAFVQQQEQAMRAAGLDVMFHTYPGQKHWFVEEDRPEYHPESASAAWVRTISFLKNKIQ